MHANATEMVSSLTHIYDDPDEESPYAHPALALTLRPHLEHHLIDTSPFTAPHHHKIQDLPHHIVPVLNVRQMETK